MKNILYATDFSETAEKALVQAIKIAQKNEADLIMLHVFDVPTAWNFPDAKDALDMERMAIKESENDLKKLFAKYEKGINVTFLAIENDSAINGIISAIEEHDPELLVIGTKGGSQVKELILGSTTKAMIKQSPVPVLSIPEEVVDSDLKKILYATDLLEGDVVALQKLLDVFRAFEPEITVAHISTGDEFKGPEKMEWFKDMVKNKISYQNISFQLLLNDNIFERLNNYLNETDFNLLVMLEKERTGFIDRLLHEDLVKKMELHTTIPLLSFSEQYIGKWGKQEMKIESHSR